MRLQFGAPGAAASGIAPASIDNAPASGRRTPVSDNTGSPDRITLSATSSLINRYEVNRSARLQQLSLAVQQGTYQVSNRDLSARIVSSALGQAGAGQAAPAQS